MAQQAFPRAATALLLALTAAWSAGAQESRAYRGLWGGLLQQHAHEASTPHSGLRDALAALQAKLLDRLSGSQESGGAAMGRHASLEDLFRSQLNLTLSMLSDSQAGAAADAGPAARSTFGGTSGSVSLLERLEQLHSSLLHDWQDADPQQLAALALMQGWVVGAASATLHGPGIAAAASAAKLVPEPSWPSFHPAACLRLQNFGNAEGYSTALLGSSPCTAAPGAAGSGAAAAASGDALRWGSRASFLLDCSRGGSGGDEPSASGAGGSAVPAPSGVSGMLQAASQAAAASVAAALDRTVSCRLAVSSDAGGGAVLQHAYERPLLGAPKLDALRIRICSLAPSTMQYPAALSRGATITLHGLKLNGRPLLPAPLLVSQASAADGCLARLYRLGSGRATQAGYLLSGWVGLAQGGGGDGWAAPGFGVGEMASVELSLGDYSPLEAAASRLLGSAAQAAGLAPP